MYEIWFRETQQTHEYSHIFSDIFFLELGNTNTKVFGSELFVRLLRVSIGNVYWQAFHIVTEV